MLIPNKNEPIFTADWSPQVRDTWPTHVLPNLDRTKPLRWLEIGSFEGRSTLWTVENVFQHPESTIVCVDIWDTWLIHGEKRDFNYEATFDHNTFGIHGLIKRKGKSSLVLPTLEKKSFHGCYIDGSHDREDVVADAHLVLPLMLPGSLVVFDDYQWPEGDGVKVAVDELLTNDWKSKVDVLHVGYQVVLRVKP